MTHLSLLELNELIRDTLDSNLEPSYWVTAEISELRENQKGHCYLELVEKEDDQLVAKIRANIWAYNYRNIAPWFHNMTGQVLKPGIKILANVQVQFHSLFGLSLNIRDIDPRFTVGERARKRQEIIDKLKKEGLYDQNRSLSSPLVPQNIAVISSPTAAGYGDFINQVENNGYDYKFSIQLFTAMMQGDEAVHSIIKCLKDIGQQAGSFDSVAIIRGGGSQVDLDCFDSYELAAAVATCPIPVFTGIGHERDETITDLVAHTKLKTPTAVSEFLISGMLTFEQRLLENVRRLQQSSEYLLEKQENMLRLKLQSIASNARQLIMKTSGKLELYIHSLRNQTANSIRTRLTNLDHSEKQLSLLNPENTLKRGYTLTTYKNKIISNFTTLKIGDHISTIAKQAIVESKVKKVTERHD